MKDSAGGGCVTGDQCWLLTAGAGTVLGFGLGILLYFVEASDAVLLWIGLPGELYSRMLGAAALPLLVGGIISSAAALRGKESGKVMGVALSYIYLTNLLGAALGGILASIFQPGDPEAIRPAIHSRGLMTTDKFADLIRNFVPDNVISACFQRTTTVYKIVDNTLTSTTNNITGGGQFTSEEIVSRTLSSKSGSNILGVIVASLAVGMACSLVKEASTPFASFFSATFDVIHKLANILIRIFFPFGAVSIIAKSVASKSALAEDFRFMRMYVAAYIVGDLLLMLVALPLIYFVFMRRNPLYFLRAGIGPMLHGVSTQSSYRTLPLIIGVAEKVFGVDKRVARLIAPLTTIINRDGCILFAAFTAVYMAQAESTATAGNVISIILLTSVSATIGGGSTGSVVIVIGALGIAPVNMAVVLALEWFNDRIRTVTNIYSHLLCCLVTWRLCQGSLDESPPALTSQIKCVTDDVKMPVNQFNGLPSTVKSEDTRM